MDGTDYNALHRSHGAGAESTGPSHCTFASPTHFFIQNLTVLVRRRHVLRGLD